MTCRSCIAWRPSTRSSYGSCLNPAMRIEFTPYTDLWPEHQVWNHDRPDPIPLTAPDYQCPGYRQSILWPEPVVYYGGHAGGAMA